MNRQQLHLNFKGDRTYIQGGDIYNSVDRFAKQVSVNAYISNLAFRHFARHDCDLLWERPASSENLIAQGNVSNSGIRQPFWVVESQRSATGRVSFDEDSIIDPASSDSGQIVLTSRSDYSPIEEIIALTKRLNYELSPNIEGKWVFGQLNLRRDIPSEYDRLAIVRLNSVPGRFSVNSIHIDDRHIGDIRFIVGTP